MSIDTRFNSIALRVSLGLAAVSTGFFVWMLTIPDWPDALAVGLSTIVFLVNAKTAQINKRTHETLDRISARRASGRAP